MSRETTALVVREVKEPFKLESIELDALREDEALVEIHATGVCHTDLTCAAGILPAQFPKVFGHEGITALSLLCSLMPFPTKRCLIGAGVIVETGNSVSEVKAGDHVLLSYAYCNTCAQCTSGYFPYCEQLLQLNFGGSRTDGTSAFALPDGTKLHGHFFGQSSFARLAVVNRRSLVKVPKDVPLSLFAPLGCGLQTGAGTVLNTLDVQPGSTVAVFGVGSVGLSGIMAAKIRKAKKIIAIDIQPSRLELAKELGATDTINSKDVDVVKEIKELCPPTGVNYALDATGVPAVVAQMVDSLGLRGRACSVGAPAPGTRASVDVFSHLVMGRQYVGCHQGDSIAREVRFGATT